MIAHPNQLPDTQLEEILLAGARGLRAETASTCAERMPRYSCTPEYRQVALTSLLRCARELLTREAARCLTQERMGGPDKIGAYLLQHFEGYTFEAFVVVFLDAHLRVIAVEEMFRGTLTQTSVHPREIVKRALAHNAAAVVLAHNHPSGELEPSNADEQLTKVVKSALRLIDVAVIDHIVVGHGRCLSMAARGLV